MSNKYFSKWNGLLTPLFMFPTHYLLRIIAQTMLNCTYSVVFLLKLSKSTLRESVGLFILESTICRETPEWTKERSNVFRLQMDSWHFLYMASPPEQGPLQTESQVDGLAQHTTICGLRATASGQSKPIHLEESAQGLLWDSVHILQELHRTRLIQD